MVAAALAGEAAAILAHEKVLNAMSAPTGKQAPTPFAAQPTDTYFTDVRNLFFDGEAIQLLHQPAAHSDGDSIVFFRRSDVIVTGDVFDLTGYPVIDAQRGGNFKGLIDAANRIVDLAIVRDWQEGGTMIIPGHGRIGDQADIVEYRDMLTIVRDRVQDADQERDDAGPGQGRTTDARLRRPLRITRCVHRGGISGSEQEAATIALHARRIHHKVTMDTPGKCWLATFRDPMRALIAGLRSLLSSPCRTGAFPASRRSTQRGQRRASPAAPPGRRPRSISPAIGCRW